MREQAQLKQQSGIAQPSEGDLNSWGYRLLGQGRSAQAIAVLSLTTRLYPASANAYDSLAEAHEAPNEPALAVQNYRRSLESDAGNRHATERLQTLQSEKNTVN